MLTNKPSGEPLLGSEHILWGGVRGKNDFLLPITTPSIPPSPATKANNIWLTQFNLICYPELTFAKFVLLMLFQFYVCHPISVNLTFECWFN